jgi:hypothetical protein
VVGWARALVVVVLLALGATGTMSAVAGAKRKPVKLTGRTVVIPQKTVKRYLTGVSKDGTTFRFRRRVGALRKLKRGKVMLLKRRDVAKVTRVKRKRRKLIVVTKPPKLPDVIKSGTIHFKGKPDVRKAFLAPAVPLASGARASAAPRFAPPAWPYVGDPRAQMAHAADGGLSAKGKKGPFAYSLTFSPASQTRLNIDGVLSFNYPSKGTSVEVKVSGYFDTGAQDVGLTVNGGDVTHSSLAIKNLVGHAHVTYKVGHGEGGPTDNPPVFRLPIAVDYSIPGPYGVPLYFKVQAALVIDLGFDTKNSTMSGGSDVTTSGSSTIEQDGKKVTTSQTGKGATITILPGNAITPVTSGGIIRVVFPKLGAGLGVSSANGVGYVELVTSMGQATGSALIGLFCSAFIQNFSLNAGVDLQLGPLGFSTPKQTLYSKTVEYDEPGCSLD